MRNSKLLNQFMIVVAIGLISFTFSGCCEWFDDCPEDDIIITEHELGDTL